MRARRGPTCAGSARQPAVPVPGGRRLRGDLRGRRHDRRGRADTSFRCSLRAFAFFDTNAAPRWLHPLMPGRRRGVGKREGGATFPSGKRATISRTGRREIARAWFAVFHINQSVLSAQRALERAFPFATTSPPSRARGSRRTCPSGSGRMPFRRARRSRTCAGWRPVDFDVDAVFLISRPSDGPGRSASARACAGGQAGGFRNRAKPNRNPSDRVARRRAPSAAEWFREPYARTRRRSARGVCAPHARARRAAARGTRRGA